MPQGSKGDFLFYPQKTKALVELFANDSRIGKIFIEPHLQLRLHITSNKIRFHGCRAVRHDDHIHVQLK
jgi:murein endopeptidase